MEALPGRVPMARPGFAHRGQPITLLTNYFKATLGGDLTYFYHYSVALSYADGSPVEGKGIGRKVIDKHRETYDTELAQKDFAYDGEKSLFTGGPLPQSKFKFAVVLEDLSSNKVAVTGSASNNTSPKENDQKRFRRPFQSKSFKVEITYVAKIPMRAIIDALRGQESGNSQEALRVLNIILRQIAAKQGCVLVRQSFFHNQPQSFWDLGGGVLGWSGFNSSFRATQGGLSLNIDVSKTTVIKPGPVLEFLVANQSVSDPHRIDWAKARQMLKNLRITASPSNRECKITGLSDLPCNQQLFLLKKRSDGNAEREVQTTEVTVYDYFVNYRHIQLGVSGDLPCINVGKPKRPNYIPLELCSLVSLQRYTKALSTLQRSSLVKKSRQTPQERMLVLSDVLSTNTYGVDPLLRAAGVSISSSFTEMEGRVLSAPKLSVRRGKDLIPQSGKWNLNDEKLVRPSDIKCWAIVNFSVRLNTTKLWKDLTKCAKKKGMLVHEPLGVIEENPRARRAPPLARVEQMFEQIKSQLKETPQFLLCLLPERKTCTIYGPWKRKCLTDFGVATQCISPFTANDQYLPHVLLKINAKLGGLNFVLAMEKPLSNMPGIYKFPTMIIGMDVCHGSPGQTDTPSIVAVVGSRRWPSFSTYRAYLRAQSPRVEMIDCLFKKVSNTVDEGIIGELVSDFYDTTQFQNPANIIIFRDGVSESQFNQVLNIELHQIIEACKFRDPRWHPKFTVIIAQKKHRTRFFEKGSGGNVPPGTVIDTNICHPRNNDFYMCAHAGIGTIKPTHYHVLLNQVGLTPDNLQELVHKLSYVNQRGTTAISTVAPIHYAHLAASQMREIVKFEDGTESTSSQGEVTSAGIAPVPQLPTLHRNVCNSMFFC
ncbi:Protein argonaute 4B [Ranunculus cassubicifolius]